MRLPKLQSLYGVLRYSTRPRHRHSIVTYLFVLSDGTARLFHWPALQRVSRCSKANNILSMCMWRLALKHVWFRRRARTRQLSAEFEARELDLTSCLSWTEACT